MSSKGRIVVIDDEVNAATALEALLRDDGYDVTRAHDARSGLQLIEKSEPDVVLTDVRMPGDSGLQLLEKLKAAKPDLPVIVMSAHTDVASTAGASTQSSRRPCRSGARWWRWACSWREWACW